MIEDTFRAKLSSRFAPIIISLFLGIVHYFVIQSITGHDGKGYTENTFFTFDRAVLFSTFVTIVIVYILIEGYRKHLLAKGKQLEELQNRYELLKKELDNNKRIFDAEMNETFKRLSVFAEFGLLSTGFYHDLANQITALNLHLRGTKGDDCLESIDKALVVAGRIESMTKAINRQITRTEIDATFSLNKEIAQVLDMFAYNAKLHGISLVFLCTEEIETFGTAVKFNQVAQNLVANAIDELISDTQNNAKVVTLSLIKNNIEIVFIVKDNGMGMSSETKKNLFNLYYTTKKNGSGLGVGLFMVKKVIENDFGGTINVVNVNPEKGTMFVVTFLQKV